MSSTSVAYRWPSCEITWQNLIFSLLMPAKVNCASAWAGRSVHLRCLQLSAGSAVSMLRRGQQMWDVDTHRDNHVNGGDSLHSGLAGASDAGDVIVFKRVTSPAASSLYQAGDCGLASSRRKLSQ